MEHFETKYGSTKSTVVRSERLNDDKEEKSPNDLISQCPMLLHSSLPYPSPPVSALNSPRGDGPDVYLPIPRRPSVQDLEGAKGNLVRSFEHFPAPSGGRSPSLPALRIPASTYAFLSSAETENHDGLLDPGLSNVSGSAGAQGYFSSFTAGATIIANTFGVGIVALPWALRQSGWCGILVIIFLSWLASFSASRLARSQSSLLVSVAYGELAERSLGLRGRIAATSCFYFEQLLYCSIYLHLISSCVPLLQSSVTDEVEVNWRNYGIGSTVFLGIVANSITTPKQMRFLAYLSTVLSCMLVIGLLVGFYEDLGLSSSTTTHEGGQKRSTVSLVHSTEIFAGWEGLGRSLGVISFGVVGKSVLLSSVYRAMRTPERFMSVVLVTFSSITVATIFISCLGYAAYGESVHGNVVQSIQNRGAQDLILLCVVFNSSIKYIQTAVPLTDGVIDVMKMTVPEPEEEGTWDESNDERGMPASPFSSFGTFDLFFGAEEEESQEERVEEQAQRITSCCGIGPMLYVCWVQLVNMPKSVLEVLVRLGTALVCLLIASVVPVFTSLVSKAGAVGIISSVCINLLIYIGTFKTVLTDPEVLAAYLLLSLSSAIAVIAFFS